MNKTTRSTRPDTLVTMLPTGSALIVRAQGEEIARLSRALHQAKTELRRNLVVISTEQSPEDPVSFEVGLIIAVERETGIYIREHRE